MKQPRITQNFRDHHASIVTADSHSIARLQTVLPRLGLTIDVVQPTWSVAPAPGPRVIFVDGDMPLSVTGDDATPADCAVIGLVGSEAPSRLRTLIGLGAQAFLTKPIHAGSVYSALFLAVNAANRSIAMQARIDDLNQRRQDRAHVLHVVTDMVLHQGITPDEAYDRLRRHAMQTRQSVEALCAAMRMAATRGDTPPIEFGRRHG